MIADPEATYGRLDILELDWRNGTLYNTVNHLVDEPDPKDGKIPFTVVVFPAGVVNVDIVNRGAEGLNPATGILGEWENDDTSSDLGHVHAVWAFTADGKTKWDVSILNGKEKMKEAGTYTISQTNLFIRLDRRGSKDFQIVFMGNNILRLKDDSSTNTVEFRKMK